MAKDYFKGKKVLKSPGHFIDEANNSIEAIKQRNNIVEAFKRYGVELKKSGGSGQYMGLCCFHDDHNPSLSVNEIEGKFNCFSCQAKGDVINLVMMKEGLTIREAVRKLEGTTGEDIGTINNEEKNSKDELEKIDLTLTIEELEGTSPVNSTEEVSIIPELSLNTIADHYHKTLFKNVNAQKYLEERGIKTPDVISRFKIGYCDGNIFNLIGRSQAYELKELNILRDSDNTEEYFKSYITIPFFDDLENVVSFYGRSINPKSKKPHLYLKGKHKSVFNRKASKVYDEIILTESIIDALSLIELGIENVQSIYGVNGFTDEHLNLLKDNRVKSVILAFDKDEAGINTSESIKEKLLTEGFKVKIITPPVCKDWNEELINNITKEQVKTLINNTVIFEKKDDKKGFEVKKDAFGYVFFIGEIKYSLSNVKESFSHNLRVNIKTEYQGERFPDNVDLYSSRSRDTLSLKLSQKFGIEAKRVEKDLLLILDYLEDEQRKKLNPQDVEKEELMEDEIKIGLEFLKNPDLFKIIVEDMTTLGYVGEDLNKQLLYLCATSRLMDDPISVMIVSQSASGKSYLVDTVAKLIPEFDVIEFHTLSQQALQYMKEKLLHKFMTMGETSHDKDIENQLRQILSGHKLSRYVVVKNEKTGEMTTEQVLVHAVVASVLTTTSSKINPENASRYFIVNTDESVSQTVRIYEAQRFKYSEERSSIKQNVIPEIIKKHHAAQRLLKKITIVIPLKMREKLRFPDKVMRLRRDHERFIDLIAVVCFLRQYQKETKNNGTFDYIECDKTDYRIAYTILINDVLRSTISEIPQQSVMIYEAVREISRANAESEGIKANEVTVSQREIREHTGFNQMFVKRYIKILVDYEYLKVKVGGRGAKCEYFLIADEDLNHIDISMIPKPEEMDKILN